MSFRNVCKFLQTTKRYVLEENLVHETVRSLGRVYEPFFPTSRKALTREQSGLSVKLSVHLGLF